MLGMLGGVVIPSTLVLKCATCTPSSLGHHWEAGLQVTQVQGAAVRLDACLAGAAGICFVVDVCLAGWGCRIGLPALQAWTALVSNS
jgi:hypothetical protein